MDGGAQGLCWEVVIGEGETGRTCQPGCRVVQDLANGQPESNCNKVSTSDGDYNDVGALLAGTFASFAVRADVSPPAVARVLVLPGEVLEESLPCHVGVAPLGVLAGVLPPEVRACVEQCANVNAKRGNTFFPGVAGSFTKCRLSSSTRQWRLPAGFELAFKNCSVCCV